MSTGSLETYTKHKVSRDFSKVLKNKKKRKKGELIPGSLYDVHLTLQKLT